MKNTILILLLSCISFSLSGQTWSEKRAKKKADAIEAQRVEDARPTDMKKVGRHLKNAGWSALGAAITIPYAIGAVLDERDKQNASAIDPSIEYEVDSFENTVRSSLVVTGVATAINSGCLLIKAGWELGRGMKSE